MSGDGTLSAGRAATALLGGRCHPWGLHLGRGWAVLSRVSSDLRGLQTASVPGGRLEPSSPAPHLWVSPAPLSRLDSYSQSTSGCPAVSGPQGVPALEAHAREELTEPERPPSWHNRALETGHW